VRTAVEVQVAGLAALRARPETWIVFVSSATTISVASRVATWARPGIRLPVPPGVDPLQRNELLLAMLDSIAEVLREVRNQSMAEPHVVRTDSGRIVAFSNA